MRKIRIFLLLCLCALALIPSNKVKAEEQDDIISKTKEQAIKDGDEKIIYSNFVKQGYSGKVGWAIKSDKKDIMEFLNDENFIGININDIESVNYDKKLIKKIDNYFAFLDAGITYIDYKIKQTDNYDSFIVRERVVIYPEFTINGNFAQNITKNGKQIKNTLRTRGFSDVSGKTTKGVIEISNDINFKHIIKKLTLSNKQIRNSTIKQIKNLKKTGFKKNKIYYIRYYTYKKINNNLTLYSEDCFIENFKIDNKWKVKTKFKKSKSYEKWKNNWKNQEDYFELVNKAGLKDLYY